MEDLIQVTVEAESNSVAASARKLAVEVSRFQPASEFLQMPTKHVWTERVFKAKGWSRAVLAERSGNIAKAMLYYVQSVDGKKGITLSPQWTALSLFNAAAMARKLNEKALQNRMLKLAAVLYEQAFEPLLVTFPEAAVWTAAESGRCYMLTGDMDNATRMLQVAEQIHDRLCPFQQIRLDGFGVLPGAVSSVTTVQGDPNILKKVEEELQFMESAVGLR